MRIKSIWNNLFSHSLYQLVFLSLFFNLSSSGAQNTLTPRCGENEITCALNDFPSDIFETQSSLGGLLDCHGISLYNPLWYSFTAVPGDITITGTVTICRPDFGAVSMSVWTLCEGGVNDPQCVISSTCEGPIPGYLSPIQVLVIPDGMLTVGQIYYLAVGDCQGKNCQYFIEIDSDDFIIPDLLSGDVNLVTQECTSNLPPFTYCGGADLRFIVDHPSYEAIGADWYWSINELDGDADASSVIWSGDASNGVGNPIINGFNMFRYPGSNWIDMTFTELGLYEICIDKVSTNCGLFVGPLCQTIEIIETEPELFSPYDVCYTQLYLGDWEGPGLDTITGLEWISGNIFLSDVLSSPQDDDDFYEVTKFSGNDGCNCVYEQTVRINLLGDGESGEVNLQLTECQLPYTWFDLTIYELDEYYQEAIVLSKASNYINHRNVQCDSLVILTTTEYELMPNVYESDCTDMGKEFSFELLGTELQGASYYWVDSVTGIAITPIMEDPAWILPTGTYTIYVYGFIPDLNHNDESVGTTPLSYIQCEFGPFEIFNPMPFDPIVTPYDTFLCSNELEDIYIQLDTLQDSINYEWIIPESIINFTTITEDNDSVYISSVANLGVEDTIKVVAYVECGRSDTVLLPLVLLKDAIAPEFEDLEACVGIPLEITYPYNSGANYIWDFGTATVIGNTNDGSPFTVSYDTPGVYQYSLSISDTEGCAIDGGPYNIEVFQAPPVPEISCIEQSDRTTLVFEWDEEPGFEYSISASSTTGQFGMLSGNQYIFTNLPPLTTATVAVTATGDGPDDCNMSVSQFSCATIGCDIPPLVLNNFADLSFCQNYPGNNAIQFTIVPPAGVTGSYSGPGISLDGLVDPNSPELVTPGQYMINYNFVETATGCAETLSITVTIHPEIIIEPTEIPPFCPGEIYQLTPVVSNVSKDNLVYEWMPSGINSESIELPQAGSDIPGTYTLDFMVMDTETNCNKTETFEYTILDSIQLASIEYSCNDNGTELDFSDDFYEIFIDASAKIGTATGNFIVSENGTELGSFMYEQGGTIQLNAMDSAYDLLIQDANDMLCPLVITTDILIPCAPKCEIQSSSVLLCNDNGTSDPGDDFFEIRVVPFVMNPGPSNMFETYINGDLLATFNYSDGGIVEYPAVGMAELLLVDVDDSACSSSSTIFLFPCSEERYDCPQEAISGMGLLFPVQGAAESNTNQNIAAQKYELSPTEIFNGLSVMATRDNNKQLCFADSSLFEIRFMSDENGLPGIEVESFQMYAVADSVASYTDVVTNEDRVIVEYTFNFEQNIGVLDGWVSVANTEDDCSFYWIWGDDTPSEGGAVLENETWSKFNSFNYCFYYDAVSTNNVDFGDLKIYPVPTEQLLYIDNIKNIKSLRMIDILGRDVLIIWSLKQDIEIDLNRQSAGIYILLFEHQNGDLFSYKVTKI